MLFHRVASADFHIDISTKLKTRTWLGNGRVLGKFDALPHP
jgi:hypothetical protein